MCTITPTGSLTFVTAGTCTIAADQAGDAAISAAPQVTQSFAVNAIAPDIPVIGTVTAADAQATVNFTASVGSGGAPISGYTVTATPVAVPGAPPLQRRRAPSPIVVTGLTNGFVYNFTVKATNGAQTSADSAAVQATPRKLELVGAPGSVPGMAGTPTATLSGGGATCTLQATGGFGPAASTPPGLQAPNGQFAFTAEQCTGAVTMTLVYPSPLPVGVQFRKPDGAGGWFDPTNAATSLNVVLNAARTTVSYTITDNGLGDTNPATGSVSDPFVPVVAAVAPGGAQAIPSLGGWALAMLSGLLGGLALRSEGVHGTALTRKLPWLFGSLAGPGARAMKSAGRLRRRCGDGRSQSPYRLGMRQDAIPVSHACCTRLFLTAPSAFGPPHRQGRQRSAGSSRMDGV